MGEAEIDLAGKAYAAFNRGDVDGALQHLHPEIAWNMHEAFARAPRTFLGHAGVREVWALFSEALVSGGAVFPTAAHASSSVV